MNRRKQTQKQHLKKAIKRARKRQQRLAESPILDTRPNINWAMTGVFLASTMLGAGMLTPVVAQDRADTTKTGRRKTPADTVVALPEMVGTAAPKARELSSPKYTVPLLDVPQTITVVPKKVIDDQGATSLRDVLRNVSGITVNAGEGGATPGDNFNVRGFSARSDLFVDGVRDLAGYSRETFNLEQVEVTKGPASAYAGRGSTGGAINLVTKRPLDEARRDLEIGVGAADFRRVTADVNQPLASAGLGASALRVSAMWNEGGTPGLDVVKTDKWGVAPTFGIDLGAKTPLTVAYYHLESSGIPSYGIQTQDSVPTIDTHKFFGLTSLAHENVVSNQVTAKVEHAFAPSLRVSNQFNFGRTTVDRLVIYGQPTGARGGKGHVTDDKNFTNQANLTAIFGTGGLGHSISAGVDLSRESSEFGTINVTGLPAIPDLANPDPNAAFTGTIPAPNRRRVNANSLGAYAFETATIGEHFELSGGLRYDVFDPDYVSDSVNTVATSNLLSWRAGVVYKPVAAGSVYAAYGTSFNPSVQNLAYDAASASNNLPPEENRSLEVGAKWEVLRRRLSLSTAVFRNEKTNARTPDPSDPSGALLTLAGVQRAQGVEVGASGYLLNGWNLFVNYTYIDGKFVETNRATEVGSALPNTPDHAFNIWTTYRFPWKLEVGGGAQYMSDRLLAAGRTTRVPSYWAFNAMAAFPIVPNVNMKLNAYNLTDRLYYDNGRNWVPAAGRSITLFTSVDF